MFQIYGKYDMTTSTICDTNRQCYLFVQNIVTTCAEQLCRTEVGNWPKKSNALALEIVSQKCNTLEIMH